MGAVVTEETNMDPKECLLCGGTSQAECAKNDCDNDWTDFWLPDDPTPADDGREWPQADNE